MTDELLVKYKELGKIVNFLTDLATLNAVVIDKKTHSQGETIGVELLSNYTAYMGSLNLMVVHSSAAWVARKILKATKKDDGKAKVWDKLKTAVLEFSNAAESLVKPLEYFSKLYNPKAAKSEKGVASLGDVLNLYTAQLEKLQTHYVKTLSTDAKAFKKTDVEVVKAGLIQGGIDIDNTGIAVMLGGEDVWIGGMQTQTMMTSHLAKVELLEHESPALVEEQLEKLYNSDELSLEQIVQKAELRKPVDLLEFDKLQDQIKEYLEKHAERYKAMLDEPEKLVLGGNETSLFEQLEALDRKILMGMCYQEFETMDSIETADALREHWDELQKNIQTIKEHPNKRMEIFSDMRFCYDEIAELEKRLESINLKESKPLTGDPKARLKQIVTIEQEYLPKLKEIESIWLEMSQKMSSLKQHWLMIIDDDEKSTCIKWTGLLLTSLLRLDLVEALRKKRFTTIDLDTASVIVTEDHPRLDLYQDGIGKAKLEALVERML